METSRRRCSYWILLYDTMKGASLEEIFVFLTFFTVLHHDIFNAILDFKSYLNISRNSSTTHYKSSQSAHVAWPGNTPKGISRKISKSRGFRSDQVRGARMHDFVNECKPFIRACRRLWKINVENGLWSFVNNFGYKFHVKKWFGKQQYSVALYLHTCYLHSL